MELGLSRAGHATELLCEIDRGANEVLRTRFPEIPKHDDICTLDALPSDGRLCHGDFHAGNIKLWYLAVVVYSVPLVLGGVRTWLDKLNGFLLPLIYGKFGSQFRAVMESPSPIATSAAVRGAGASSCAVSSSYLSAYE